MSDAIRWLEAGFDTTLQELRRESARLEEDGYKDTFVSPHDLTRKTNYLRRFQPVGYARRGSVFFSIKPDNEIGIRL